MDAFLLVSVIFSSHHSFNQHLGVWGPQDFGQIPMLSVLTSGVVRILWPAEMTLHAFFVKKSQTFNFPYQNLFTFRDLFNIYVNKQRWVGGLSNVYSPMLKDSFSLLSLFTRGRQVVKKGQNSVYVNIEWSPN